VVDQPNKQSSNESNSFPIPNLDDVVLSALDFFSKNTPPNIDIKSFKTPFVVGSGNALNTGTILFAGYDATFADESNFKSVIESSNRVDKEGHPRDVVVISASGGKDSVWEVELAKKYGLKTTLLTTKGNSGAAKVADNSVVFKSLPEPYTYNTSTYMGMILGVTHEDPSAIKEQLLNLNLPGNYKDYKGYAFVLPDKFMQICPMIEVKKDELFGPHVSIRAFSVGHARHAKFVIRSSEELVISFGQKNENFGDPNHRLDIDLPEGASFATIMALTYYMVGKIQAVKPQYFKENIERYVKEDGPKAYGPDVKPFDVIVPGSA
jgi:hypothetical protein